MATQRRLEGFFAAAAFANSVPDRMTVAVLVDRDDLGVNTALKIRETRPSVHRDRGRVAANMFLGQVGQHVGEACDVLVNVAHTVEGTLMNLLTMSLIERNEYRPAPVIRGEPVRTQPEPIAPPPLPFAIATLVVATWIGA